MALRGRGLAFCRVIAVLRIVPESFVTQQTFAVRSTSP